jgi:uncharacterized protein
MSEKSEKYALLYKQIASLTEGESNRTANLANTAAAIHEAFGFWWTGFYLVDDKQLVLGPFQGPVACTSIKYGRGVCGTAWKEARTVIVPDVEQFPGHIACSSESRSEIVVPVWRKGQIIAVLDIDSKELDTFDNLDKDFLETICAELSCAVSPDLRDYIATNIIPRYSKFDQGHAVSHVTKVMERSLCLACRYDVNPDMVYTAAAYHDLGIAEDRKTHNIISARMIREDSALSQWFSPEQIDIIADAAEDHRASLGYEPRTIYGKITAEADRLIFPDMVVERCIQYGRAKHPDLDKEAQWERVAAHLEEKYGRNGYLKVWLPESSNAVMLDKLRDIIDDKRVLREMFDKLYR